MVRAGMRKIDVRTETATVGAGLSPFPPVTLVRAAAADGDEDHLGIAVLLHALPVRVMLVRILLRLAAGPPGG